MRRKKYNIIELRDYLDTWPVIKTELFGNEKREIYEKRKKAIELYVSDVSVNEIYAQTGISRNRLSELIGRCLKINPITGKQYGYEGLIPNKKMSYGHNLAKKSPSSKTRGSFKALLLRYPSLEQFIRNQYFNLDNSCFEKNIMPSNLHKKFLSECKKLGISDYEYPFNVKDNARRTFYNYLKILEKEYAVDAVRRENKDVRKKFNSTGKGQKMRKSPIMPFSTVQLDGHKLDVLYSVEVVNKHGEIIRMPAMRMWLIAVEDVATRTILGYSLTPNENYNQFDVLRAIRNAIIPKTPIKFTLAGLEYPDNYGFPSLAIPSVSWALPNTIMIDNAKSQLANNVIDKLTNQLLCSLNFGSVATPETRGIIERVFGTLEERGYHRIVSTTGSNTTDVRRTNAEKDAVKYCITYDDIVQLTEYFIAVYNNSPNSSLDNESPIECMKRRLSENPVRPRIANQEMKKKVYELTNIAEIKTVRGNVTSGRRPYITYEGVEYRNDILSQSANLIGKKICIEVNPDDIRTIKGYFEDGTELGILYAVGEWGQRSHSLKTRREAMKLARYNKQKYNSQDISLEGYENELKERARTERRARTKAARIQKESQGENNRSKFEQSVEKLISEKQQNYTKEEMEAIMNAETFEDAFDKGLL